MIQSVECGVLEGARPRLAGCNARLGEHGRIVRVRVVRLTTTDGVLGWGAAWGGEDAARALVGKDPEGALADAALRRSFEAPLWDLVAKQKNAPVYALLAQAAGSAPTLPYRAPCYDTSLYFDDLHLASEEEAADLIATEAQEGYARGHRAFKIKVGRGARHLPPDEGIRRDIAIVRAVRQAVGTDAPIMIDANNGFNLNLTKQVLAETADCDIFWMEEAFHEDPVLYRDLKEWMAGRGIKTFIADGEGQASPTLMDWAREGLVDVIQYDIMGHGITAWLETGKQLDGWGRRSAPHHYGGYFGNYASCHLAGAIKNFTFAEWDEAAIPGIDASAYHIADGQVHVPDLPGFGLDLDESAFTTAMNHGGFRVTL